VVMANMPLRQLTRLTIVVSHVFPVQLVQPRPSTPYQTGASR
jgi:hypothetical protein